jgi:heat shock protein HslJ
MKKYYLIIVVAVCMLANCISQKKQIATESLQQNLQTNQIQNAKKQKDLSFENTKWILKTVDGVEVKHSITQAFIIFNDDRASGSSGCNSFSGTYYLSGNVLKFDEVISTKRGCIGKNPERQFFSVINRADACMIVGNKLIITQMGEEIATFEGTENLNINQVKRTE